VKWFPRHVPDIAAFRLPADVPTRALQ